MLDTLCWAIVRLLRHLVLPVRVVAVDLVEVTVAVVETVAALEEVPVTVAALEEAQEMVAALEEALETVAALEEHPPVDSVTHTSRPGMDPFMISSKCCPVLFVE